MNQIAELASLPVLAINDNSGEAQCMYAFTLGAFPYEFSHPVNKGKNQADFYRIPIAWH